MTLRNAYDIIKYFNYPSPSGAGVTATFRSCIASMLLVFMLENKDVEMTSVGKMSITS